MEQIIEFCNSIQGVLVAILAVLGSCIILIDRIKELIEKIRSLFSKKEEKMKNDKSNRVVKSKRVKSANVYFRIFMSSFLFLFGVGILVVCATKEPLPLNVKLTNAVWEAYNNGNFEQAIRKADECIDEFEPSALREQNDLERSNASLPPVGKVAEEEKEKITKRGLLNDVATCWFLKGRSLERLGRTQEAIQAYCKAAKYSYARTYDPDLNEFWSPSQTASDRISFLKGKCEQQEEKN